MAGLRDGWEEAAPASPRGVWIRVVPERWKRGWGVAPEPVTRGGPAALPLGIHSRMMGSGVGNRREQVVEVGWCGCGWNRPGREGRIQPGIQPLPWGKREQPPRGGSILGADSRAGPAVSPLWAPGWGGCSWCGAGWIPPCALGFEGDGAGMILVVFPVSRVCSERLKHWGNPQPLSNTWPGVILNFIHVYSRCLYGSGWRDSSRPSRSRAGGGRQHSLRCAWRELRAIPLLPEDPGTVRAVRAGVSECFLPG